MCSLWSAPAVGGDGSVYVGTVCGTDGSLVALTANGTVSWRYPSRWLYSSPSIHYDGSIIVGAMSGVVISLNAATGAELWRVSLGPTHYVYCHPTIAMDGTVYVTTHAGSIFGVNAGGVTFGFNTTNWVEASPVIAPSGHLVAGSFDNSIYYI
jgi:outer membrane protein assembly factor BamB